MSMSATRASHRNSSSKPFKFLFFGCWNKTNLKDDNVVCPRDKVLNGVHSYLSKKGNAKIPIVVAGDNIYPFEKDNKHGNSVIWRLENVDKVKVYNSGVIQEGFKRLANARSNADVHMIVGNHNVKATNSHGTDSAILSTQVQAAKTQGFHFYPGNTVVDVCPFVRYIFINTNDVAELASYIDNRRAKGKWNIVVGHEPIFSCKEKSNGNYKLAVLKGLPKLVEVLSRPGTVYMCADVHNFQAGIVSYGDARVMQVVSGTGGAKPDPVTTLKERHQVVLDDVPVEYRILAQENPYGFCEVEVTKRSQLKVTYMPINSTENAQTITFPWI